MKNLKLDKNSFHPFQGRPPFGHDLGINLRPPYSPEFPSLSGKTFIRTIFAIFFELRGKSKVSIPFREDLHSDPFLVTGDPAFLGDYCFHPFQGRPPFGQVGD